MLLPLLLLTACAPTEVTLMLHGPLEGAAHMPVVVSPDESCLLYFKRVGEGNASKYLYCLAGSDGGSQRELFATPVDWDDMLNSVTSPCAFSKDGRQMAVATTRQGGSVRSRIPDRLWPAIVTRDGAVTRVACELGECSGFGFSGDRLVFLDITGPYGDTPGYRLRIREGETVRMVDEDPDLSAAGLCISPDGQAAAFFAMPQSSVDRVFLRVVNLASGEIHDSSLFRMADVAFEGLPSLFWKPAGRQLLCHVCTDELETRPFELTCYDYRQRRGRMVSPEPNLAVTAVLDEDHLAVWSAHTHTAAILRLSDRRLMPLPEDLCVLGGRGRRLAVANLRTGEVHAAKLRLTVN